MRSATNLQIVEEASAWFVEVAEGSLDAQGREALNGWLRRSPEHVRAYLEAAAIWENAGLIDRERREDAEALAMLAAGSANVVPLKETRATAVPAEIARARRPWARAAAVALLFVGAGAAALWWQTGRYPVYRTDIGGQRSMTLTDGSTVILNSSTRVRVRFTDSRRDIDLEQGQALFKVAKDSVRPFVVHGGAAEARAVGTRFDVDRRQRGIVVTVLEGRVAVSSRRGPASYISAGQRLVVSPRAGESEPRAADVATATAWTQRRLVFSSTPLEEVVEEYNRYHERPLMIRDAALAGFNISGTFSSTDAASLLDFLREQPGIAVRETSSGFEIGTAAGR